VKLFVEEPHSAIDGPTQGQIVNLTDRRASPSRSAQLDLLKALGPGGIVREFASIAESPAQPSLPHLVIPARHDVRSSDVFTRRLHGTLAAAAERGPIDFSELLLTPGVGARTVQSLAMVAEVVHGTPYRFQDPARFSLAHGGRGYAGVPQVAASACMLARVMPPVAIRSMALTIRAGSR
jgi:hypothetical protein